MQTRGRAGQLFAMPAAENPTVDMVEAAYRYHGLTWRYINCEVPTALFGRRGARSQGLGRAGGFHAVERLQLRRCYFN